MNFLAPEGWVCVCTACGKRSRDRYGDKPLNRGWDESCMLNAVVVRESALVLGDDGRVVEVKGDVSRPWEEVRP